MVEETPSITDAVITVSRVTCDDCHSLCGGVASSDFFSAVGGGVGVCAYATGTTSTSVRVLNSSFYDCSSDYGETKNFHCFSEASLFPSSSMSWFMNDHVFEDTTQGNSTAYSELHRSILSNPASFPTTCVVPCSAVLTFTHGLPSCIHHHASKYVACVSVLSTTLSYSQRRWFIRTPDIWSVDQIVLRRPAHTR